MSPLISLENVSLHFGLDALLDHAKFQLNAGERVCLIGRNGTGKSTLLNVIDGSVIPNDGTVWRRPQLKIARLQQTLPRTSTQTVYEFVAEGLSEAGALLTTYHALTHQLTLDPSTENLNQLEALQKKIDALDAWQVEQQINTILTKLELPPDAPVSSLSGGWQRRAALATALVSAPDVLLLDEPTNHLDIEAIQWLEDYLLSTGITILFVTHDRALLKRLATRIIELDRGQLRSWPGNYEQFLIHKAELLHAEEKLNANFDKKLAEEEKWIRQGIKARRTRNEGRVRALEAMRAERSERREVQGTITLNTQAVSLSGQLVIEASHLSHTYTDNVIIHDCSLRIMRGDRIGLIGPNGAGKSTLLNLLLGQIPPQEGQVKLGTRLQIAYFDQMRMALDPEKTILENVVEGSDFIEINGKKQHIISYLGDFLFTPQRARSPVKVLSGGECNRLLLAKLFSREANVLVMDEPTNDLDIETLELLEEKLVNYKGTLLLVSHDRVFLDNVVTSTLVFEGQGKIQEYIGGYEDWLRQRPQSAPLPPTKTPVKEAPKPQPTLLSSQEQNELKKLPQLIEQLEKELAAHHQLMADPDFYQQVPEVVETAVKKLKQLEQALEAAYQRWEALENQR